jgi:hypothetical protein
MLNIMAYFNEEKLNERLKFQGITFETREVLKLNNDIIRDLLPEALDKLYTHIADYKSVAKFFKDKSRIEHAKQKQLEHWDVILETDFGEKYLASVTKIGHVHNRIGLEPSWYISAYSYLSGVMVTLMSDKVNSEFVLNPNIVADLLSLRKAFVAVAAFDMSCALDVYWGVKLVYFD